MAGGLSPITQPRLLTWAAPSSLGAAALAWPWGHWSTSVSSTSRSSTSLAATFVCRDQSRAQFPTLPKGHGLRGEGCPRREDRALALAPTWSGWRCVRSFRSEVAV